MELHEREFLILTEKAELYRKGVRERMQKMLKVSQEQLLTSDALTQSQQDTKALMNVSVLAAKREGRTMMQQERSKCAPFLRLADRKVSPLQAARGVNAPMSAEAQEKLAAQLKSITDSDAVRSLVFDLVSARKETDAAPDLDKLCQGAAALLAMYNAGGGDEGATVAALRAVSRMPDPIAVLQSGQFSISDETLEETRRAGALFTQLQKLNTLLPTDGCLHGYYADLLTRCTYRAVSGGSIKDLETAVMRLGNRCRMVAAIRAVLNREKNISPDERRQLESGLFDLYAREFSKVVIEQDDMEKRISKRIAATNFSVERRYIADDRGAYGSLGSAQAQSERAVFAAQTTRQDFESKLLTHRKDPGVQAYLTLPPEVRVLLGLLLTELGRNGDAPIRLPSCICSISRRAAGRPQTA